MVGRGRLPHMVGRREATLVYTPWYTHPGIHHGIHPPPGYTPVASHPARQRVYYPGSGSVRSEEALGSSLRIIREGEASARLSLPFLLGLVCLGAQDCSVSLRITDERLDSGRYKPP